MEVLDEAESCLPELPLQWKLLRPLNCQRTPPAIPADHVTSLSVLHCCCFFFCFCLGLAPGLPGPRGVHAYFVCLLVSAQNCPALSPAQKMLRTYFPHWSWKTRQTSLEQRWARGFPCCMVSFCRFQQDVVFDHRSTHRNISDLRRVFPSDRTDGVSSRTSNCCFLVCLHFPTGCYHRRGVSEYSYSFQFSACALRPDAVAASLTPWRSDNTSSDTKDKEPLKSQDRLCTVFTKRKTSADVHRVSHRCT